MLIETHSKRGLGDGSWQIFRRFRRAIWREAVLLQRSEFMVLLRGYRKSRKWNARTVEGLGFSMPVESA